MDMSNEHENKPNVNNVNENELGMSNEHDRGSVPCKMRKTVIHHTPNRTTRLRAALFQ